MGKGAHIAILAATTLATNEVTIAADVARQPFTVQAPAFSRESLDHVIIVNEWHLPACRRGRHSK